MPLSWNEIRSRALEFSKRWELETSEDAEAKIAPPLTRGGWEGLGLSASKPPRKPCWMPAHNSRKAPSPTSTTRSPCRPFWLKSIKPSTAPWMPATAKLPSPAMRNG